MGIEEMIKEFVCPGCVCGSDTCCGKYQKNLDFGFESVGCKSHVMGTTLFCVGKIALGLPKGFCRSGNSAYAKDSKDYISKMYILCWTKNGPSKPIWDKFNVPVWAMEKDGFLFVRTYRPRINETVTEVIEGGTLDMLVEFPGVINVGEFHDEID